MLRDSEAVLFYGIMLRDFYAVLFYRIMKRYSDAVLFYGIMMRNYAKDYAKISDAMLLGPIWDYAEGLR
jgi:hypothetical protein